MNDAQSGTWRALGGAAGDLRVRQGDIVIVLSQDGEWWEGIVNGERGYFPGNYVKIL